jgi:hypothetical protein
METAVVRARDTLAGSAGSGGVLSHGVLPMPLESVRNERLIESDTILRVLERLTVLKVALDAVDDTEVAKLLIESEVS